ncbi:MAG: YccF domain-containing protein, partial [Ilumatobacteraceae bacterium]
MAKFVGNVLWLVLCGFEMAVAWLFIGAFLAITVVGLPFGLQCF